jgi:hypothetical protein
METADSLPALDFSKIGGRILFGDDKTAYRDPSAYLYRGTFHIFFTLVETEDGLPYHYLATVSSRDLVHFSELRKMTVKDRRFNYSSPGNVIEFDGWYWLCIQTYPREHGEKYTNDRAKLFTIRTRDFVEWTEPELIRVKGPGVAEEDMGRMIDPYLVKDKDDGGLIWCFYKQNGVSMSCSRDMKTWRYAGRTDSGENVCVLVKKGRYYLFNSPRDGINVKVSGDLSHWEDTGKLFYLNAKAEDWSRGRVTAGFVLDLSQEYGKYLMFYHASGPGDESTMFDTNASIAVAVSNDFLSWD